LDINSSKALDEDWHKLILKQKYCCLLFVVVVVVVVYINISIYIDSVAYISIATIN